MRVILDMNAVSELKKPACNPGLDRCVDVIGEENLFLSVITLGEIRIGITRLAVGKRREDLERWANGLEAAFALRILPVDLDVAHIWADITNRCVRQGRPLPANDGLIAATAIRHGMKLITCNISDFESTGVLVENPWT